MAEPPRAPRPDSADRLFAAAIETFARKGYHGATTRDIAAMAGMSPAALYVHHTSKEDILYRISRRGHRNSLALIRAARASSGDPVLQLRTLVHDFVAHHAESHTTARIVNYELEALAPEHRAEIEGMRRVIEAEVREVIRSGVDAGVFRCGDQKIAAAAILSLGIDVARWFREPGGWSPGEIGEQYAELALRMLGAPAD
jgi:AcrR family transcriptional regulator